MNNKKTIINSRYNILIQLAVNWIVMAIASIYGYLLFHSIAEVIVVAISLGIFFLAWNTRHYLNDGYFVIIGGAFLFISGLTLLHALAFKGMGVFMTTNDPNLATQLWLIARYLTAGSFLIAPFFAGKKMNINKILLIYLIIFIALILTIFPYDIFPVVYQKSIGLTPFKKINEYILIAIFLLGIWSLRLKKHQFDKRTLNLLTISMILGAVTEFLFALYFQVSDIFNLLGHFILVASIFPIYIAVIEVSLSKPYLALDNQHKLKETALIEKTKHLEIMADDLKKFQMALESASDYIVITNTDGKIIFANRAAEELTGYSREEMLGQAPILWNKSLPNDQESSGNFYKNIIGKLKEGQDCFFGEVFNVNKKGHKYTTDLRISPVNDEQGNPVFYIFIERDITRLKEIDKIKTEFISMASHQLRTPLASISLSAELLLRQADSTLDPRYLEYVKEIFASTQKMSQLISDLLSVTKNELSVSDACAQSEDLTILMNEILEKLKPQLDKKGLLLVKNYENQKIELDFKKEAMAIIVRNIILNSVQFTPSGGKITVSLSTDGKNVLINISDTGCGITKAEINKIFDKFFRTRRAEEANFNGSGLGLYVAKSYIDKMGGKIWVESEEGMGTTINIQIPSKAE